MTETSFILFGVFEDIKADSDHLLASYLNRSRLFRRQVFFFRVEAEKPLSFALYCWDRLRLRLSSLRFRLRFFGRLEEELSYLWFLVAKYFISGVRGIFYGLVIKFCIGNIESQSEHASCEVTMSAAVVNKASQMRTDLGRDSRGL